MILINTPIEIDGKIFKVYLEVEPRGGYEPTEREQLEILEKVQEAAYLYQCGIGE
jgi:hypothetical protein